MKKLSVALSVVLCLALAVFCMPFPVQAAASATVTIQAPATVAPGQDFTAQINITHVDRFSAGNFDVVFDHSVLEISDITPGVGVTDGKLDGTTVPVVATNWVSNNLRVVLHVSGIQGVSGSGYLCQLHFHVKGSDGSSSDIEFINGVLSHFVDNTVEEVSVTWIPATISVAAVDTTPPTVTAKSPTGSNVAIGSNISATFSEAMNTSSAESAFSISPTVSGTFSWANNTMTFDPSANLAYGAGYTVTIAGTAKDLPGNGLDGDEDGTAEGSPTDDYSWSFTTEVAPTEPTIAFSPASFSFCAAEGGANPEDQTLEIWNSGTGTLDWLVSDDAAWLSLSPPIGSSTGEHDSVAVSVHISGMSAGDYGATITISAPGATNTPQTADVLLHIVEFDCGELTNVELMDVDPGVDSITVSSCSLDEVDMTNMPADVECQSAYVVDSTGTGSFCLCFTDIADASSIRLYKVVDSTWTELTVTVIDATTVEVTMEVGDPPIVFALPTAPPPPPPDPGVGGTAYPPNKLAILAPWIALGIILAGGITWLVLRRRRAYR